MDERILMSGGLTALVPAGRRPGVDPLAAHFGADFKAVIPIHGEPMVAHVVKALLASPRVERVVILTQEPESFLQRPDLSWLAQDSRIVWRRSSESVSASVLDAMTALGTAQDGEASFLLTTADHPLLTPAMIDAFVTQAQAEQADIAVGFVERRTLLAKYPENRRTWLKFRGGWYSGANLFYFGSSRVEPALTLWREVEQDRKKVWKLFAKFGPWLFVQAALRLASLRSGLAAAGRKLGLKVAPVVLDIPEACIDVDKVEDFHLVEKILSGHQQ